MFRRSAGIAAFIATYVLCGGVAAAAQGVNEISVLGGTVEVSGAALSGPPAVHQPLSEKETLRTGPSSIASLELGADAAVTLGEQTEVQILRLSPTPIVWLERGFIKASSSTSVLQISTKYGGFAPAELPFAVDLLNSGSGLTVTAQRGALHTQDVEAASVVFRAASSVDSNSAVRTYSVNSHVTIQQPAMPTNVFGAPCGTAAPPAKAAPKPGTPK